MRARPTRFARDGQTRAEFLVRRLGSELRLARLAAGLSQERLAQLAGVSQSMVSLIERGRREVDWSVACAVAGAAGHDLSVRLFPVRSVSLRDSGQLLATQGIVAVAHPSWHRRLEVPVGPGDARAADLLLVGSKEVLHVEVERSLFDFQAQLRAAQRKRSSLAESLDRPVRLVIAIPGTRRNRAVIHAISPTITTALPARSAKVWRAIRDGEPLGGDGLLLLRVGNMTHPS